MRHRHHLIGQLLFASLLTFGCSEAVTDPLDVFEVPPGPVLGRWITETADGDTLAADVQKGAGFLFGTFRFEQTGIGFDLQFTDASWNGEAIRFETRDVFGDGPTGIRWTALFLGDEAEDGGDVLRLFPEVGGGIPFSVEYVRPE